MRTLMQSLKQSSELVEITARAEEILDSIKAEANANPEWALAAPGIFDALAEAQDRQEDFLIYARNITQLLINVGDALAHPAAKVSP